MPLLCFGRKGASRPLLLLYGPTIEGKQIIAPAYTVQYPVLSRSERLVEMRQQADKSWKAVRGGLIVSLKHHPAGHHLHEQLILINRRKPK